MKSMARVGVFLLIVVGSLSPTKGDAPDLCGDCWCVNNPTGMNDSAVCPPYGASVGVAATFEPSVYNTFFSLQLNSTPIALEAPDGSTNCFPFREAIDPISTIPESELPQCVRRSSTPTTVCAFKYESDADCVGRSYSIIQYDSAEEATADGAFVSHTGNCGVCSTAHDMALRMSPVDFQAATTLCGVGYSFGGSDRFSVLVDCFINEVNLTPDCALLWAHYSAVNTVQCAVPCAAGFSQNVPLNKEPPACEFSDCLQCSEETIQKDMDTLSGRTLYNSGIVDLARPCDDFSRIVQDPCADQNITLTNPPTPAPTTGSSGGYTIAPGIMTVLALFASVLVI